MKKIVIAASGLFLVAMTACNKTEMPTPQTSTAHAQQPVAREVGAVPTHATPVVSVTPPKPSR